MSKATRSDELGITHIQTVCDLCGKPRNTRRHQKCSRLRQQINQRRSA